MVRRLSSRKGGRMGLPNDTEDSQSFVRSYPKSRVIYVKIAGTMDLETNEYVARECANIVKVNGPWTGIADLVSMNGFNSKGTGVWQDVFKTIKTNIDRVYIATTSTQTRMVTQAWGFFVSKKIYAFDTVDAMVEKAKTDLYLPEDILLKRVLPMRKRLVTI